MSMDMREFLKMFNIIVIFMLIAVFLYPGIVYSSSYNNKLLRLQIGKEDDTYERVLDILDQQSPRRVSENPDAIKPEDMRSIECLYYPAAADDVHSVFNFIDICPNLKEIVFVDIGYSPSILGGAILCHTIDSFLSSLKLRGFSIVEEPDGKLIRDKKGLEYEGKSRIAGERYIERGGIGIFKTKYKGRDITFKLYSNDFYLCNPPEIDENLRFI